MIDPVYIALDVESGGTDPSKSLLSAYVAILDKDLDVVDELDLKIKPDDDVYVVTGEALRVNRIKLATHDLEAITYKEAGSKVYDFLYKNNPGGKLKLIPLGHNVAFDVRFLCAHTLNKKSWDKFCSYRTMDTGTISTFLMMIGRLPEMKASLGVLADHFNIKFDAHTAKGDVGATILIMRELMRLGKQY